MKLTLKQGIFWGLVIGIASALLYAPKAGKEFQEELKEKAKVVPEQLLNLLESFVDLALSILDFAKEIVKEQKEKLTIAVSSGFSAAKEKSNELRSFASKTVLK